MIKNAIALFIIATVILIVFLPAYTSMQDLRQKNVEYKEKIEQLVEHNALLKEEMTRLREDPEYLERIGREKMGLVREGEVVFKIVPEAE